MQNLRNISKELGEKIDEDDLESMISEFDRDQDGGINLSEFMYIIKHGSSQVKANQ